LVYKADHSLGSVIIIARNPP